MDVGTGIAIAGVWLLPAACALSKTVTGLGMRLGCVVSIGATCLLLAFRH